MTPIAMVDELIEFIKPVVAEFTLQTNVKGADPKPPQVIGGFLKDKQPNEKQDPPDFPFVIVRFLEENDNPDENTAQVRIYVGTYSDDPQNGWRDAMNVAQKIKHHLLSKRYFGSFCAERPFKTTLLEEQPMPEWIVEMTVTVSMPQIQYEMGDL
jgi:hypothetical protein